MFWREQIGGVHGHNSHLSNTDETQFYKCYIFLTTESRWGLLQGVMFGMNIHDILCGFFLPCTKKINDSISVQFNPVVTLKSVSRGVNLSK